MMSMIRPTPFDPARYGPLVASLLGQRRLPELGPGRPEDSLRPTLQKLTTVSLAAGRPVRDATMLDCCRSGLWLQFDFLDESHTLSQEIDTPTGSYWHGIMHRREPDYGNAKYWFRRIGNHPILDELGPACAAGLELLRRQGTLELDRAAQWLLDAARWDPFRFVDLCETVSRGKSTSGLACREAARIEWELLFDYCYQQGIE